MKMGIDFGSNFSYVSFYDKASGECYGLMREDSNIGDNGYNYSAPTVFYYGLDETNNANNLREIIGEEVNALTGADKAFEINAVRNIKSEMLIGNFNKVYKLNGKDFALKEIVCKFLKFLIDNALIEYENKKIDFSDNVLESIVITVPVRAGRKYREYVRDRAAEAANLKREKVFILDEPAAAALNYFGNNNIAKNNSLTKKEFKDLERILVYDLGGGTFDAAVVEYNNINKKFKVTAQDGEVVGGNDFDSRLFDYILSKYNLRINEANIKNKFGAKKYIRRRKHNLSRKEQDYFSYRLDFVSEINNINSAMLQGSITREEFEQRTNDLLIKTKISLAKLIINYKKSKSGKKDIDNIVLSGGASLMPMARLAAGEIAKNYFPKIVLPDAQSWNTASAVSYGASIYAELAEQIETVSAYTYAYKISSQNEIIPVIRRNTPFAITQDGDRFIYQEARIEIEVRERINNNYLFIYEITDDEDLSSTQAHEMRNERYVIPAKPIKDLLKRKFKIEFRLKQGGLLDVRIIDEDLHENVQVLERFERIG